MARARDAVRVHAGGGRALSVHRRAQLDAAADADRVAARLARRTVARGARARADALCHRCDRRRRRVPLAVATAIAAPLAKAGNRRNYVFIALVVAIAIADLAFHLSLRHPSSVPAERGIRAGLDLFLFIVTVMGGRVIPVFTNNGVPGCNATRHPSTSKRS